MFPTKKNYKWLYFFLLFIILDIIISIIYYYKVVNFLQNEKMPIGKTIGIVFFHDHKGKFDISQETKMRLNKAMELKNDSKLKGILCVGGLTKNLEYNGAYKMKNYLISKGITDSIIYIDTNSFDTHSNWKNVEKICKQNSWTKAIAISSPMHLYRISNIKKKTKIDLTYSTFLEKYKKEGIIKKWKDIQHEFISFIAKFILPNKLYNEIILKHKVDLFQE